VKHEAFAVFHPAWGYLADAYELRQISIEIEGKSPSDSELTTLIEELDGMQCLFVQPQISSTNAAAIARVIGADIVELDPLAVPVPANLMRVAQAIRDSIQQSTTQDGQAEETTEETG